jgi:hypothetical protein
MAEPETSSGNTKSEAASTDGEGILTPDMSNTPPDNNSVVNELGAATPTLGPVSSVSPGLSRSASFSGSSSYVQDVHDDKDWDPFPPLDRLTLLDILDNFALSQQIEKFQRGLSAQTEKVRKSREALNSKSRRARERMVDEWRRRVPSAEEQLDRYKKRMRASVEKLGARWNDTKVITLREKIAFIFGVMNIFVSGYLIGGWPDWFHIWYSVQVLYFMPIRYYTYKKRGYHYFLADLCYFVNLLVLLSIWAFPQSKRLFTAAYCLSHGNNAVAIIMWRNSLVFHSLDKVTSLFIHIMPCATLHCLVHLIDPEYQRLRFPAIWTIKNSPEGSETAYANIFSMLGWSSIPYFFWQLTYYFFITVRRREKIAAGRPTSFTWLRKSYSKSWIGKAVLSLPEALQEPAFMMIQYTYAVLTMLPCPLWFFSRWASAAFLMVVFAWSVYNGSTYYIDVFGKRFQKELEAMKAEVAKWQNNGGSPEGWQDGTGIVTGPAPSASGTSEAAPAETTPSEESKVTSAGAVEGKVLDELPASVVATGADAAGGKGDSTARERKAAGGAGNEGTLEG